MNSGFAPAFDLKSEAVYTVVTKLTVTAVEAETRKGTVRELPEEILLDVVLYLSSPLSLVLIFHPEIGNGVSVTPAGILTIKDENVLLVLLPLPVGTLDIFFKTKLIVPPEHSAEDDKVDV